MKMIYCLSIFLCPYLCSAQNNTLSPLSIGDAMVPVLCDHVLNNASNVLDLSKMKGKLVILDFMLTTCGSCVKHLGEYDSLQKAQPEKIQFIMVTPQKKEIAQVFLQKNHIAQKMVIPVIAEDTKLKALFPHEYFSHLVWIGPEGKVKAITHGEYVTKENIQYILAGKVNHWPVKRDVAEFDFDQPLLVVHPQIQGISPIRPLSAALLPYIPELPRNFLIYHDLATHSVRRTFINQPITEMYLLLMGKNNFLNSCILLNISNKDRFIYDESRYMQREWDQDNTFCYQSFLADSLKDENQQQRIFRDLDYHFNINTSLRPRILSSLILKKTADYKQPPKITRDSMTVWSIANQLNMQYSGRPVFVGDPATNRIKIPINPRQANQPEVLNSILHAAGFEFITERRQMDVLIIQERNVITPKPTL